MKTLTNPLRRVMMHVGVYDNGLHKEVVTVHARSDEMVGLAAEHYQRVTRPGMDTAARIDRALFLHNVFDAEARHNIVGAE